MDLQLDTFDFENDNGNCVYSFSLAGESSEKGFFSTSPIVSGVVTNNASDFVSIVQNLIQLKIEAFTIKQLVI